MNTPLVQEKAITPATSTELLPLLYRIEQHYGWSVGMRAIAHVLLAGHSLPQGPIADIGCGGGRMLGELATGYPDRPLLGVDLHAQALVHASSTVDYGVAYAQADLHTLPFPDDAVALLLALDTYDQRNVDLGHALTECRRTLRPGGLVLLRVSAHAWLTGPHDAAFNTGRRYEAVELVHALNEAGLIPERVTYANTLLSLPEGAVRIFQRWRLLPFLPSLYTTSAVNRALASALVLEARWLRTRDLPGGLSLYAIARKPYRHHVDHPLSI